LTAPLELRRQPRPVEVDRIAAHRHSLLKQELPLRRALGQAPVGPHNAVPGNTMVLSEDEPDESWRTRIDVAEGAHEPLRDRPDAFGDTCRAGLAIFSSVSGVHTIAISPEGSLMAIALPPTIARFIDASNARDLDAAVDCFSEEAVVEDEGRTHRGIAEVRAWKQATEERFRYTIEPTGLEERDGRSLMRGILAGNFPGSPVELTYDFRVVDDAIESLRIHP
jgi:hypothetical protein